MIAEAIATNGTASVVFGIVGIMFGIVGLIAALSGRPIIPWVPIAMMFVVLANTVMRH